MSEKNFTETDNRKWDALSPEEREGIQKAYQGHGKYFTNKSRSLSDLIFNWLFILNSGGLVSVITILVSECKKTNMNVLMGICFIFGIIFIYIATKFSKWQSDRKGKELDKNWDALNYNKITVAEFLKRTYQDVFPCDCVVTLIESLSLIFFIIGLICGIFIFY